MNSLLDGIQTPGVNRAMSIRKEEKEKEKEKEKEESIAIFTNVKEQSGKEEEISIEKGGKVVRSTGKCNSALVTCKEGFKKGSIRYFQVKMLKTEYFPRVGIVEKYDSGAFRFSNSPKCVLSYYFYGGGSINWCKGGRHSRKVEETGVRWKVGETVKMKVDLVKFEVSFFKNGKMIGSPVLINKRDAYYPAIAINKNAIMEIEPIDKHIWVGFQNTCPADIVWC